MCFTLILVVYVIFEKPSTNEKIDSVCTADKTNMNSDIQISTLWGMSLSVIFNLLSFLFVEEEGQPHAQCCHHRHAHCHLHRQLLLLLLRLLHMRILLVRNGCM